MIRHGEDYKNLAGSETSCMHAWKLSERESGGPVFGLMRLCKVRIENPKGVKQ